MSRRENTHGHRSVDWEKVTEKRDWSSTLWTAAAILLILAGFVGGMVFRTNITGGPDYPPVEGGVESRGVRVAEQAES